MWWIWIIVGVFLLLAVVGQVEQALKERRAKKRGEL